MSDTRRLTSRIRLANGFEIPWLGLGTWKLLDGKEAFDAVTAAIQTGYRHIDTAAAYGNEKSVGKAIRENPVPREEIFLTTKLWNDQHGAVRKAFDESIKRLGLEYVDLYLMHWPVSQKRIQTWKTLQSLVGEQCKMVGVSNFTVHHLDELMDATGIVPLINQVEFSPFLHQAELAQYCKKHKIQLVAYSPLTRGKKFSDPTLVEVASKYQKTPAQVLIRWCLQHNLVVIPKSGNPARIRENANVFDFEISAQDMKTLDNLNENLHLAWDPTEIV